MRWPNVEVSVGSALRFSMFAHRQDGNVNRDTNGKLPMITSRVEGAAQSVLSKYEQENAEQSPLTIMH